MSDSEASGSDSDSPKKKELSEKEKVNLIQFIKEGLQFFTKIIWFQAGAFVVEDLLFMCTPHKMVPLCFLFFHSAFIYAAYEFYQWKKEDCIKSRKGIQRACWVLLVFGIIVWLVAGMAAVHVSLDYAKTTSRGLLTTTINPATGMSTQTTALDASVIGVNNEMHRMVVYTTNGVLGSLGILGLTFQTIMSYAIVKQVKRYREIFRDDEVEMEAIKAAKSARKERRRNMKKRQEGLEEAGEDYSDAVDVTPGRNGGQDVTPGAKRGRGRGARGRGGAKAPEPARNVTPPPQRGGAAGARGRGGGRGGRGARGRGARKQQ